jgi:hypothetical protein
MKERSCKGCNAFQQQLQNANDKLSVSTEECETRGQELEKINATVRAWRDIMPDGCH